MFLWCSRNFFINTQTRVTAYVKLPEDKPIKARSIQKEIHLFHFTSLCTIDYLAFSILLHNTVEIISHCGWDIATSQVEIKGCYFWMKNLSFLMAYYHTTAVMRNVFVALSSRLKKILRIKNLETGISENLHIRPNQSSFTFCFHAKHMPKGNNYRRKKPRVIWRSYFSETICHSLVTQLVATVFHKAASQSFKCFFKNAFKSFLKLCSTKL